MRAKTIIIAAMGIDGEIGQEGKLPWHNVDYLKDMRRKDLKRFKELTMGHPVIMGRKTFESILQTIGKPLTGRQNIVLTSDRKFQSQKGVSIARTIEEAISIGSGFCSDLYIIGGAQVYKQIIDLDLATHMYLTEIQEVFPNADTYFPEIKEEGWKVMSRDSHETYAFVNYVSSNFDEVRIDCW